jgi:hypothetical protein
MDRDVSRENVSGRESYRNRRNGKGRRCVSEGRVRGQRLEKEREGEGQGES